MKIPLIIILVFILLSPIVLSLPLTNCGFLNSGNYNLQNDVSSQHSCFILIGNNVELDCMNRSINYNGGMFNRSYGINGGGLSNITIRNCRIQDTNPGHIGGIGIYLNFSSRILIENNKINTDSLAFGVPILLWASTDINILNNVLNSRGSQQGFFNNGLHLKDVRRFLIKDNLILSGGQSDSQGIMSFTSINGEIKNNNIVINGTMGSNNGIYLFFSSNETIISGNNIISSGGAGSNGVNIFLGSEKNSIQTNYIEVNAVSSSSVSIDGSSSNSVLNNTLKVSGAYSYGIFNQLGNNAFSGNTIESNTDWLYFSTPSLVNMPSVKFKSLQSSIEVFPTQIISRPIQVLSNDVVLNFNDVFLNSTKFPEFNKTANVRLTGLSFIQPKIIVDWDFDGTYVDCLTSDCFNVRYSSGVLEFTTRSVGRFSSVENYVRLCGDCNEDRRVSILDALIAARHSAGLPTGITPLGIQNCDVVTNGVIDILDALTIARYSSGIIPFLTC